jgi:hypothetical protein
MKKKLLYIIFPLLIFLLSPSFKILTAVDFTNPLKWNTIQDFILNIVIFLRTLAILVTPIVIIIAGYFYMSAGGDPEKIEKAKNTLIYAIVGLIIILAAQAIIEAIENVAGIR